MPEMYSAKFLKSLRPHGMDPSVLTDRRVSQQRLVRDDVVFEQRRDRDAELLAAIESLNSEYKHDAEQRVRQA